MQISAPKLLKNMNKERSTIRFMNIAVTCSDEDLKKSRKHLTENGIPDAYYMMKDPTAPPHSILKLCP